MIIRLFFGLPLAALVTLGLFVGMSGMIKRDLVLDEPTGIKVPVITAKLKPTDPKPKNTPKPDPVVPPETIEIKFSAGAGNPGPVVIDSIKGIDAGDGQDFEFGAVTGPQIRVAPAFPEACRSRGIEGVVIVEFDVTSEGAVTNVRILSSPHSCFDRSVKRAVSRWKYAPRLINGRAAPRKGVREVINFQLS